MKILQVVAMYGSAGGVEVHTQEIASALERAGHSCVVVYGAPGLDLHHVEGRREYQVPGLLSKPLGRGAAAARQLEAILQAERPDAAYVHTFMEPAAATVLVRAQPTVFFAHTHDLYCPAGSKHLQRTDRVCPHRPGAICFVQAYLERCQSRTPLALARNYLEMIRMQRWAQQVDLVQVDSEDMKARLVVAGYRSDRVVILPPQVRIPELAHPKPPASSPPLVLFAGRLTPQKGFRHLLEAVRRSRSSYRLIVAGEGYERAKSRALAERRGVGARVDFLGWVDRQGIGDLYDTCSVVVVPSVWPEPFGLVGPEAMAHARPVVAFSVGGIPEWLEDGVTGFLVPPRDARRLAERIDELLEQPELAQRMGEAGRERALRLYGMDEHRRRLVALLERAIDIRRKDGLAGGADG